MYNIYFDNSATTPPCPQCVDALNFCLAHFGNPSSLHKLGLESELLMEQSREIIADSLGADPKEIFFTSCATESSNTAIFGAAKSVGKRKRKFVTTAVEHPATAKAFDLLEQEGFEIVRVSPDSNGVISAHDLVCAVDENTAMISVMLVNNETGAVLPVKEAFTKIKKKFPNVLTHCDIVQAYMKMPISVKKLGADFLSISGHKIHACKGVGALYIKKGIHIPALIVGGGQEKNMRSGTQSVPLIYSMAKAVEALNPTIDKRAAYVKELSDYLHEKLSELDFVHINSENETFGYVNSFAVKKIKSETLLHFLESFGIYVSSGSACSRGKKSSVLTAFGIPDEIADCTIRVSFSHNNTKEEIDVLVDKIIEANETLAKMK